MRRLTNLSIAVLLLALLSTSGLAGGLKLKKAPEPSPLDRYIKEAEAPAPTRSMSPGSLYDPGGRFGDLARDQRAALLNDIVTIDVLDNVSALSKGATATNRTSSAKNSVTALAGHTRAAGPLANLATLGGQNKLDSQGATSRQTALSTTLTARVTHVLANGNLVVEGTKDIMVNSERQKVCVRGVIRPNDLNQANHVSSDRLADLEIRVDGKGVVNDAVRRPNFLYRLLLGVLPF